MTRTIIISVIVALRVIIMGAMAAATPDRRLRSESYYGS